MDLWNALGVSRHAALVVAACGLVAALVLAAAIGFRKSRDDGEGVFKLDDR